MRRRDFLGAAASLYVGSLVPGLRESLRAQTAYPAGPVTIYVPFAAGGASDILSRVAADYARDKRNVAVGVEFRPGAGGTIAPAQIARSNPDGASIGFYSVSPFLTVPHLQSLPYASLKDFTYISIYAYIPIAFYVNADSKYTDWSSIVQFAKDNPGKLRWGTAGVRGIAHLAVEAAFRKEGIKATFVPFGGGAEAMTALLGNHIEAAVSSDYGGQLAANKVRLIAFTGTEKLAGYEKLPAFKELNYPLSTEALYGLFGPAKLPKEVVDFWEGLTKEMTGSETYKVALDAAKASPIYLNSAQFTANVEENYAKLGEQIEALGFKKS